MNQTVIPGVDNVERARRMGRHRASKKTTKKEAARFNSGQLELPGIDEAEEENARLQPGANHSQLKSN